MEEIFILNTLRKGKRFERELEVRLQNQGWITYKPTWNKFSKQKDIFGLFDILAIQGHKKRWIQVKSKGTEITKPKGRLLEWKFKHATIDDSVELWIREPFRKWRTLFL